MGRTAGVFEWLDVTPQRRRLAIAAAIFAVSALVIGFSADPKLWRQHTAYNHFALLAEAWLQGRLDLGGPPPDYTGNNDFAHYEGQWFVTFPPFPATLLLPAVWLAGGDAARVSDGAWFATLSALAPAVLFLALEKLKQCGQSQSSEREHVGLSLLFAFGSVYFFSAVQGTVWYAAHGVAAILAALYLLFSIGAQRPIAAGTALALGFMTRTPLLFATPLFVCEAWRVCRPGSGASATRQFLQRCALFAAPMCGALVIALWLNQLRFDDWWDFGYRHLAIRWQRRIAVWGLFDYHYLAKNLGVMLTSLPYKAPPGHPTPFLINGHGLALWVTTPLYLWLLWPRRRPRVWFALGITAFCVALPTLFYQNTGWLQFGYRFSNDYAIFLFAMLAIGGYRFGTLFRLAAALAVAINTFGAVSFNRSGYSDYYYIEPTQRVLYQLD